MAGLLERLAANGWRLAAKDKAFFATKPYKNKNAKTVRWPKAYN